MKKDLIKEARRYVENAEKTLSENGRYNPELKLYEDDSSYNVMHLSMDYDGTPSKSICSEGFRLANDIINRCAKMLA